LVREKRKISIKTDQIDPSIDSTSKNELPLRYEIYRKLAHLVVLGIILFYFTLGSWIRDLNLYLIKLLPETFYDLYSYFFLNGTYSMIFNQYLVIFLVAVSLFGLLSADFVRILKPKLYPLKPVNKILRKKELSMRLGPQISMAIGCFSIIILYGLYQPIGPIVISTAMIMSVFGDMSSNLIGRVFGKKKIRPLGRRKSTKTYLGLFAGFFVALSSGIFLLFLLKAYSVFNTVGFFVIPLSGAFTMALLDYLDLEIDDNLTYPFILSIVMFFLSFFFI
jgi:dolichol kinase